MQVLCTEKIKLISQIFRLKILSPRHHKVGGVWYSLTTPGQGGTTLSALVLTTSLTQVLSYGNDAFFTQHGEFSKNQGSSPVKLVYNFVARGGAQAQCDFGCAPLRSSGSGLVIRDHSDHSRSNEPMNPIWTRIHS